MDQFNQKADRATHGALSLPALKDGASRAILVKTIPPGFGLALVKPARYPYHAAIAG